MTDQLIFVHDKRRDAYVDKTSEIVGLRPAGAYVYVDYGAARVFRYRKEHVVCYPLLATRRQVRIYKDGTLQEPYDTLFDYGKYVRLGAGEGLRSPAIEKSRIEAVDAQPLPADKERLLSYFAEVLAAKASLESETDTEAAEEVPEGEKKSSIAALLAETMQRIDPQDPRTALYAYLNGRTAACDVDNVALVYPFGCNASQKLAVQRALGNRVSVVEGPPGTGKTQTILNIVANLLMQGKTVGVVSNNNAAVDNVRDKLSKYEYGALMAELGNRTRRQAFFADKQQDFMPDPTWRLPAEERTALRTRLGELSAAIDELFRVDAELADLRKKIVATPHSRIPVHGEDPEEVIGIVVIKDVVDALLERRKLEIDKLVQKVPVIPESMPALEAMELFRGSSIHVAFVQDEYGRTLGLVTAADLLSAIAGSLEPMGEGDDRAVQRDDGSWLLPGDMAADEMAELIGFTLPPKRRYETVAGLVIDAFKHLPSLGQAVKIGNWRFEVVDLDGRRVDKVLAIRLVDTHRPTRRAPLA